MNFGSIDYLKSGNLRQQQAYKVLTKYKVMEKLAVYQPIVAGTIPIAINIDESDLDVLCHYQDKNQFIETLKLQFGREKGFQLAEKTAQLKPCVVVSFWLDDFAIEIFAQDIPTKEQTAYRHLLIEYNILMEKGEGFRQKVIALKKCGIKTEPAFAELLGLDGDPYLALLDYDLSKK